MKRRSLLMGAATTASAAGARAITISPISLAAVTVDEVAFIIATLKNGDEQLRSDYLRILRASSNAPQLMEFADHLERWMASL